MKSIPVILLILISGHLCAQTFEGNWEGTLKFGAKEMDILITLSRKGDTWEGSLSSQSQQLKDLIISPIDTNGDSLQFVVPLAGGRWEGNLSSGKLNGHWFQGGYRVPLDFEKTEVKVAIEVGKRMQTPTAPFPYEVKEVQYKNDEDQTTLAGTLTIPRGQGPFPAAILLSVAGPNDRDMSFGSPQHKPFMVLADFLTRNGIAVLRSDDRGVGQSEGDLYASTLHDFAVDAKAAFNLLVSEPRIEPSKIGFIGNSEGTLVGPLATTYGCNTAFIITLGGIGIHGSEVILDQIDAIGELGTMDELTLAGLKEGTIKMFEVLKGEEDRDVIKKKLRKNLKTDKSTSDKGLFLIPQSTEQQLELFSSPWYRYQVRHDAGEVLRRITCPFLALHGSNDPFVNPDKNLEAIAKNLSLAGNDQYALRKFKEVNHIFQEATDGSPAAYQSNEVTFSPKALEFIKSWLSSIL